MITVCATRTGRCLCAFLERLDFYVAKPHTAADLVTSTTNNPICFVPAVVLSGSSLTATKISLLEPEEPEPPQRVKHTTPFHSAVRLTSTFWLETNHKYQIYIC